MGSNIIRSGESYVSLWLTWRVVCYGNSGAGNNSCSWWCIYSFSFICWIEICSYLSYLCTLLLLMFFFSSNVIFIFTSPFDMIFFIFHSLLFSFLGDNLFIRLTRFFFQSFMFTPLKWIVFFFCLLVFCTPLEERKIFVIGPKFKIDLNGTVYVSTISFERDIRSCLKFWSIFRLMGPRTLLKISHFEDLRRSFEHEHLFSIDIYARSLAKISKNVLYVCVRGRNLPNGMEYFHSWSIIFTFDNVMLWKNIWKRKVCSVGNLQITYLSWTN